MIYTFGVNGHYQSSTVITFDNYAFGPLPPDSTPPRARQPIGVNQPPNGGNDYPFIRPSPDIEFLLGDFYLSYADDTCSYEYPFRIQWMYGFGDNEVTPPAGYPTPTHIYDILVKDANDVTVFDSTIVGTGDDFDNTSPFKYSEWYSRYIVIEWTNASKDIVCRCTKFIGWDSYSTDYQDYDDYIVPDARDESVSESEVEGGVLDPRTYNKLPLRLRSLNVRRVYGDLGTVLQGDITLHSNYNIEIQDNPASIGFIDFDVTQLGFDAGESVIEGSRLTNRIAINSAPGLGAGTYPSCNPEDTDAPLRRLNNAQGDSNQNIILDSGVGCIRLQQPVELVDDCPRQFEFNKPPAVPSATETGAHTNRLINDCVSCCDCDYFARTYEGLKRQWFAYQQIADDSIEARDQFEDNVTRWSYQKVCRESNPTVMVVRVLPNCIVDLGITYGNTSACCLVGVHVRLTFEYYNGYEWVDYPTDDICDKGIIRFVDVRPSQNKEESELVDYFGNFPVIDIVTERLAASEKFQIAVKLCFPGCIPGSKFRCHMHIWWEHAIRPHNVYCDYPPHINTDTDILNIWQGADMPVPPYEIRYQAHSPAKELNTSSAFCLSNNESCERPLDCSVG